MPGTYTFTCPAGVTSIIVECRGGGGAGGGVTNANRTGGGGGGGAFRRTIAVPVVGGNNYTVVVGAGGIGTLGAGPNGGNSTFNGAAVVGNGGSGGGSGASGAGGAGGTGTFAGGAGATGSNAIGGYSGAGGGGAGSGGAGTNAVTFTAGAGGAPDGGDGGSGLSGGTTGAGNNAPALLSGGGGGGARNIAIAGNRLGGSGRGGSVVITWAVCAAPAAQPTLLVLTPYIQIITGSFTAAAPAADGYLVIRTATATAPADPVNSTVYTPGTTAQGGYIESAGAGTGFSSVGLNPATQYWYWIYSFRNINCSGGIQYLTASPLTQTATTFACGTQTNVATITTPGTATYNWSALTWSLGHLPTSCEHAELILNNAGAASDNVTVNLDVSVSVLGFQMRNMSPGPYVHIFMTTGNVVFSAAANMTMTAPGGNRFNRCSFANQGSTIVNGNLTLGRPVPGITDGHSSIGSTGSVPNQTYTLYGDMTFNPRGYTTDEWAKFIFDKAGTQYLYNYTATTDTTMPVLFENLIIGNTNASTLIMQGTSTDSYIENVRAAGVTIGVNSTLDLPADYSLNKIPGGFPEPFAMLAGSVLRLGGDRSIDRSGTVTGVAGSNFPASFSTYTFAPSSTINYYGNDAVTQTVYAGATYSNLVLTNGAGLGRAPKISTAPVTVSGTATVSGLTDFTPGTNVIANGPFNVLSTGALYCAANLINGTGAFTLNSLGLIGVGHAQGITAGAALTGNVQMTGGRSFSTGGNYLYYGNVNQITGNGLPAICNDLTIANTAGGGTVIIATNQLVNGINMLQQGTFDIGTTQITINGSGTLNRSAGFMKANRGFVDLKGNSGTVQNLAGSWFAGKTIYTLTNSNTTGITLAPTLNDTLIISGAVLYGTGTVNSLITTNDNLTLISRDTATARFGEIVSGSGNAIAGKVNVERYISIGRKWRHLSFNTTSSQTARDSWMESNVTPNGNLTPGYGCIVTNEQATWSLNNFDSRSLSGPSVKYYNPATNSYISIPNTTVYQMNTHSAYYNYVRGDRSCLPSPVTLSPALLRSKGTLNTGNRAVNIPSNEFAAIGNPYASAIDIRRLDTVALGGIFYVWDPKLTGIWGLGAYQTLYQSGAEYRIIPGGGSYGPLNSFTDTLESGQAFFVKAWSAPGALTFKESAKNIGARTMSFAGTDESAFCILSITDPSGNAVVDGTMAAFGSGYNNEVGYGDAMKMANTGENVSFKREGKLLVIERRAKNPGNDTLFLNISGMRVHQYQWDILIENMMAAGREAFFVDKFLNTGAPLILDNNNPILFDVTSIAGSYAADRFMIVFKPQAVLPVRFTGISAVRNTDKTVTVNWQTDNEINMKDYTAEHSGDGVRFTGVGVVSALAGAGGIGSYSFKHNEALAGVNFYRVKGRGDNGQIQYTAIAKVSPLSGKGGISIFPNPITGSKINLQFENNLAGIVRVSITTSIGQLIQIQDINVHPGNVLQVISLKQNTPAGTYNLTVKGSDAKTSTLSFIVP